MIIKQHDVTISFCGAEQLPPARLREPTMWMEEAYPPPICEPMIRI